MFRKCFKLRKSYSGPATKSLGTPKNIIVRLRVEKNCELKAINHRPALKKD